MIWFIQVDGLIMDARELPAQVQAQAFELGVIPYIPALGRDGTAAWLKQNHAPDPSPGNPFRTMMPPRSCR